MVNHVSCEHRNCQPKCRSKCVEKTHVFNSNLQKQLLSDYDQKSKIKSQERAKLISDKKSLIAIIFGQCNDAIKTEITLGTTYKANRDNGNLIRLFATKAMMAVCLTSHISWLLR